MSWPGWTPTAPPLPAAVAAAPVQSALLQTAINSAPSVHPPTLTQYSPEQWAHAQQQNWQQWAQWQQQYQQWHQQYGAEYQKSLTAMQTAVPTAQPPLPAVASMAPPLPVEPKPPLPPEEPPTQPSAYSTMPLKQAQFGYSTAPPSLVPQPAAQVNDPYGQRQSWQNPSQKRPYSQEIPYEASKKPNLDKGVNKWGGQDPQNQWQGGNQNYTQPPPQTQTPVQNKVTNVEELSEAEKKFDKEFAAWEAQFNKWKDQNVNHPDKVQYKEYEKKWESWRNSLLERREQMRKKRLSLTAAKPQQQVNYSQPPPVINQSAPASQVFPSATGPVPNTDQSNFSVPPPNQNNEPLAFKNNPPQIDELNAGSGFLTSTSSAGGIPGLDLVKDEGKDIDTETPKKDIIELDKEEQPQQQSGRPDLDAISKGINNILGDQKLMSMLSIVTQKPPPAPNSNNANLGYSQARPNFGASPATDMTFGNMSVPPPTSRTYTAPPPNIPNYNEQSNQSYDDRSNQEDYYHQREDVTNFDDQTRSSFTMGPCDQDQGFRNRGPHGRLSGDRMGGFGPGVTRNNFGPGKQRIAPDNLGIGSTKNERFGDQRNVPESTFSSKGNFGRNSSGPASKETDRFGPNRGNNYNDRFSNDNFRDNLQNEGTSFGNIRNDKFDNIRGSKDQFNSQRDDIRNFNRSGEYNRDDFDNYNDEDNDNYNDEEDYDKYHNRFIDDDDYQDDYQSNDKNNRNRDFEQNQNKDFQTRYSRDYKSDQNRDYQSDQNRDFQSNQNRDFSFNQSRNFQPNQNRDHQGNQNRDFLSAQNRDFQSIQNREFPFNQNRDLKQNLSKDYEHNRLPPVEQSLHHILPPPPLECIKPIPPALKPPVLEEQIFEPTTVIDYEHKSIRKTDVNVTVEPTCMFDYHHQPLNCIPYTQRPEWLSECIKFIREFEPTMGRIFERPSERIDRYPGRSHSYEGDRSEDRNKFERDRYERDSRFEREERFNWEREDRFEKDERIDRDKRFERDRFDKGDRMDRNSRFERDRFEKEDRGDRDSRFERDRLEKDERENRFDRDRFEKDERSDRSKRFDRDYDRDEFIDNRRRRSPERDDRYKRKHGIDDFSSRNVDKRNKEDRNTRGNRDTVKENLEDLSEDEMDWEAGEKNRPHNDKSRSASPILSNPPNPSIVKEITTIEDIITQPGRFNRPPRIVIILRGPPGSGKTHLAKLIKDKEVEHGGSAPRILSLDDYFMIEHEKETVEDGKLVKVKEMVYEYEVDMEESYRTSFIKSFKKTITDGYFPFIIVDNVNDKVKYFGEMWSFAKQNGFQVYICQMDLDPVQCTRRNIHNRTEAEIEECIAGWEPTPTHHPTIDASTFLQSNAITEVEMEVIEQKLPEDSDNLDKAPEDHIRSKWDTFDCSSNNLAKLDGLSRPLRKSRTMEEYLQLEDEWQPTLPAKPGQKRVRWADLEEQRQLEKMKAFGFVVGQTNWDKMMDPAAAANRALRQTKYI